jgi:hypothetical protein
VSAQNFVLLCAVLIPPVLAIAVYYFGFRSARRHDERES